MEENDIKRIIFDCLNDDHYISELKAKIINMSGLKTQAEFNAQINRINELEQEKKGYDSTIEGLRDKITEYESETDSLTTKLDQVKAQFKNDELKLEQYRADMKNYLSKLETQEKEIGDLEQANKTLQAQLSESEEHFKNASAESMKNLQEVKRETERIENLESKIKTYEDELFDKACKELNSNSEQAAFLVEMFDSFFEAVNSGDEPVYIRFAPEVGDKFDKVSMKKLSADTKKGTKIAKVLIAGYKNAAGKVVKQSLVKLK